MSDSIPVQLDAQQFLAAIKSVRTELDQLRASFIAFAETPANKLKVQAAGMATSVASMVQTVDRDLGKVAGNVEKAMVKAAESAKKGGEKAGKEFGNAWSKEMKNAAGAARAAFNQEVVNAGTFSSLVSGKQFGQITAPMLATIKTQAKAMWSAKALAEKEAASEYSRQVDMINAQIKAAHDRREQAQATQLARLKNQTKAMWDGQVAEEKAGAARLADALRRIKTMSAALTLQMNAQDRGEGSSIVKGKNFGASIASTEQELALAKANAATLAAVRGAALAAAEAKAKARGEAEKLRDEHGKSAEQARNLHSAFRGLAAAGNLLFITYGALLPLTTAFFAASSVRNAIETYKDLEYQLKFIQALSQDYTKTLSEMQAGVISASLSMGVMPVEAAKGMRVLAQAGLSASDALKVLPTTLAVATVGELDMATAAETLTGAMHAFGGSLNSMTKIGDVFVKAAAVSNTSVASIAESMKQASSIAQEFKVSVEDVGTMLAALAKRNIVGSAAGTAIRNMFAELAAPRGEAKKVAAQLQLNLFDPLKHTVTSFFDNFLPDLRKKLEQFNPESQTYILHRMFNERGAKAMAALLGMTPQDLADLRASVTDSAGYAMKVFVEANNTIQGDLNKLKAAYSSAAANAGAAGAEPLRAALQGLTNLLKDEGIQSALTGLIRLVGDVSLVMGNVASVMLSPAGAIASLTALGLAGRAAGAGLLTGASSAGAFTLAATGVAPAAAAATTALSGFAAVAATLLRFTLITAAIGGTVLALSKLYDWVSKDTTSQILQKQYSDAIKDADAYNAKLREEIELLKQRNIEAAGGVYAGASSKAAAKQVTDALAAVDDAKAKVTAAQSGAFVSGEGGAAFGSGRSEALAPAQAELKKAQDTLKQARQNYDAAVNKEQERMQLEEELAIRRGQAEQGANAGRLASGTKSFDKTDPSKAYGDEKRKLDLEIQAMNLRAQQEETYSKMQEDALRQQYDRGLLNYKEYQDALTKVQGEYLDKRLALQNQERATIVSELDSLKSKAGPAGKTPQALLNDIRAAELKLAAFDERTKKIVADDLQQRERAMTDLLKPGADLLRQAEQQHGIDELNARQTVDKLKAHNNLLRLTEKERFVAEETAKIFDKQEDHLQKLIEQKKALERSGSLDGEMPNAAATAQWIALSQEIDDSIARMNALKAKTAAELREIFDAQKNREHLKKLAGEYEKLAEQLNENLADALMNAGRDGGKSMRKFIEDELVRKPFKIWLMGELKGVSGFLAGLMKPEGAAASSALGTVGSYAQAASGLNTMWGAAAQFFGGGTAGASAASLGYANTVGALGGDSLGALISANGGWAGVGVAGSAASGLAGPVLSKAALDGTAAFGANSVVAGSGAGPLSAIGPLGWTALAVLALSSLAGKGETRAGGQYGYSFDGLGVSARRGTQYTGLADGAFFMEGPSGGDPYQDQAIGAINSMVTGTNKLFEDLGSNTRIVGFNAGYESSEKGRGGVFAGGKLSTGALFGETGEGDNYAGTLFEQWSTNSPDAKTALENFGADLSQASLQALQAAAGITKGTKTKTGSTTKYAMTGVGGEGGEGYSYEEDIYEWVKTDADKAAQAAAELASGLPKALLDLIRDIDPEKLTGPQAEALLNRIKEVVLFQKAVKDLPFKNLAEVSFDAASALFKLSGGAEALTAKVGTYYQEYYSDSERAAVTLQGVGRELSKVGITLPTTRDGFRALVEAQDLNTESGQKAFATLMNVAGAFASVTKTAEQAAEELRNAAMDKVQKAYDLLQRVVDKERDRAQTALDTAQELADGLQSIFDVLESNIKDLYDQVDPTMSAAAGSAFISNAVVNARATGYLPESDELSEAIAAARSGIDEDNFASRVDADRARLLLAGQLSELKGMSETQLTAAQAEVERQRAELARLDGILQTAKDQLDVLNGVNLTLTDINTVIQQFNKAVSEVPAAGGGSGAGGGGGAVFGPGATSAVDTSKLKYKRQIVDGAFQYVTEADEISSLDKLAALHATFNGTGDLVGLLTAVKGSGYSLSDLQAVTGYTYADWANAAASVGIPHFDVGTNYVPEDMLAVVHKGEAIIPAAYNPAAGGSDAAVLAELRALRVAVEALHQDNTAENRAMVSFTAETSRLLNRLAPNGNALQVEEAP